MGFQLHKQRDCRSCSSRLITTSDRQSAAFSIEHVFVKFPICRKLRYRNANMLVSALHRHRAGHLHHAQLYRTDRPNRDDTTGVQLNMKLGYIPAVWFANRNDTRKCDRATISGIAEFGTAPRRDNRLSSFKSTNLRDYCIHLRTVTGHSSRCVNSFDNSFATSRTNEIGFFRATKFPTKTRFSCTIVGGCLRPHFGMVDLRLLVLVIFEPCVTSCPVVRVTPVVEISKSDARRS